MNIWCFSCTAMVVGFLREAAWQSTPKRSKTIAA
jgi:hypothetical protein